MEAWKNESEVKTKTWAHFLEALDEVSEHLVGLGYSKIIVVGKSFGGHHGFSTRVVRHCKVILASFRRLKLGMWVA